jgi:hypothetical protein
VSWLQHANHFTMRSCESLMCCIYVSLTLLHESLINCYWNIRIIVNMSHSHFWYLVKSLGNIVLHFVTLDHNSGVTLLTSFCNISWWFVAHENHSHWQLFATGYSGKSLRVYRGNCSGCTEGIVQGVPRELFRVYRRNCSGCTEGIVQGVPWELFRINHLTLQIIFPILINKRLTTAN